MGDVLKKFGRYFLLDHIAQGGMAEIYRARLASTDGAGRLLVIKRIQAGFGANNEFLQMFKSEIKTTMGFNHPNIVQLYDFGEEQQQPYIAMEFIDGRNLRQFQTRFNELKQTFPCELAAHIIEQSASGLHYAHSFKDKITGQALNVVHRDISPQNIIVSFDGTVKVIDFGIAKATTNSEATRAGVIKGKPSYLSPEQISGDPLDGRCDLFALGIVLWELLTGKKLFAGENDLAVLKLIESCNMHVKPPSTLNPKVPKELDYISLKALAKQREKRYQNGEEMQRALHKFLYQFSPDFNPGDLAYVGKDLFKNEIVEDRKRLQKLNEKVEQLLSHDIPDAPSVDESRGEHKEDTTTIAEPKAMRSKEVAMDKESASTKVDLEMAPQLKTSSGPRPRALGTPTGASRPASTQDRPASARSLGSSSISQAAPSQRIPSQKGGGGSGASGGTGKSVGLAAAAIAAIALFGPSFGINIPILSDLLGNLMGGGSEATLVLQGNAANVSVMINGQPKASRLPATLGGIPVGTPFRVKIDGGAAGTFEQDVTLKKGEQKVLAVRFTQGAVSVTNVDGTAAGGKSITLRLNLSPGGAGTNLTVNGRAVDSANPVVQVPLDAPLELVAERPGFRAFRREFVLEATQLNGLKEWLMDVPMEPDRFGFLTVRTTPSADAVLTVGGQSWTKRTPIENDKVPVGSYTIRLVNEVLGMEKIVTTSVSEGKQVTIDERLEIRDRAPAAH